MSDTPQPDTDVDPADEPEVPEHEHDEQEEFNQRTSVPDDFDPERGEDDEED